MVADLGDSLPSSPPAQHSVRADLQPRGGGPANLADILERALELPAGGNQPQSPQAEAPDAGR